MSDDLADLADRVRTCLKKSDDYKTTAGAHLRQAREICQTNGTEFMESCRGQDFGIGKSQIYRLMDGTSTGNVRRAAKSPMGDADPDPTAGTDPKPSDDADLVDPTEGMAEGAEAITPGRIVDWFATMDRGKQTELLAALLRKIRRLNGKRDPADILKDLWTTAQERDPAFAPVTA